VAGEAGNATDDPAQDSPEGEVAKDREIDDATGVSDPMPEENVAAQEPEKRDRPKDFAEWTLDEYRDAYAENGNRFREAIVYLSENKVGDSETAQLLSELLIYHEPPVEAPPETDDERELQRYEQRKEAQLRKSRSFHDRSAQAIIPALGLIGTNVAIDTLSQVIAGSLDTGLDPRRACESALKTLIEIRDNKVQEFIYLAVTAPSQVRPVDDGVYPPEQLQSLVMRELPSLATHELRTKLGKFAAEAGPADPAFQGIWRLLVVPRADNLRGQLLLYMSPKLQQRESLLLRKLFTQHSRRVLDDLLGIPVDADIKLKSRSRTSSGSGFSFFGGGASRKPSVVEESDTDLTYEVVREIWSLRFLAAVSKEIQKTGDLQGVLDFADLVASIPVDENRQGTQAYLNDHWDEVARLNNRQLPEKLADAVRDPGLLLVYKSVPRRRDPKVRAERQGRNIRQKPPRPTAANAKDSRQLKEESKYIWMDTSERIVQTIAARMQAAAIVPEDASTSDDAIPEGDDGLPADFELPFGLHAGAHVVATHHVLWPEDVQSRIGDQKLSPLEVSYVRIECEDVLSKVTTHYQRQLKGAKTRFLENEGRWLDLVQSLDTGWNQSTDIMIQRVAEKKATNNQKQRRRRNEKEALIVEILIVATERAKPDESEDDESNGDGN